MDVFLGWLTDSVFNALYHRLLADVIMMREKER